MDGLLLQQLLPATVLFVGGHFLLSSAALRAPLVARLGEWGFRGVYSLVALAAFAWMLWAYAQAPYVELWGAPVWARWLAVLAMPLASVLVVAGYLTPNPSAIGGARVLARDDPAPGVFKITRHPVMIGVALWALAHLLANGDGASLILFGGLLVLAVGGIAHIERRRRRAAAEGEALDWLRLTAATSIVPFAAVAAGRAKLTFAVADWGRFALGLVVYAVLFGGHRALFGVSPLP